MTLSRSLFSVVFIASLSLVVACGGPTPAGHATPQPSSSGAGAGGASQPAPAAPVFDAHKFGAKGDGVTDDTQALVRAMRRAVAAGGGTVYLQHGSYLVPQGVGLPNGVSLRGDGASTTWLKGRLDFGSRSVVSRLKIGDRGVCAVRNRAASYTRFLYCRFRGGGGSGDDAAVVMLGGSDSSGQGLRHVTFKHCAVERDLGVEDWSKGGGYGLGYNDITVHENSARGGTHIAYLSFIACHVGVSNGEPQNPTGSPRAGIEVWTQRAGTVAQGWTHVTIKDCVFEATDRFAIDLADYPDANGDHLAGPALIQHNTIKGAGAGPAPHDWCYCICLEAPHDVTIRDNLIYRARFATVCGSYSQKGGTVIADNTIDLTVDNGIPLEGDEAVSLRGANGSFTGNIVRAGDGAGELLRLNSATKQLVSANKFYDLRTGGPAPVLVLADAAGNTISSNLFSIVAPGRRAIGTEGTSTGNRISGNRVVRQ
jgi:hypothetical protein